MVKLMFKDIESLNAVTGALHKNGYKHSTFIIWKKDNSGIDYLTVHIEGIENGKTVDVKHGRWEVFSEPIVLGEDDVDVIYKCSVCHCNSISDFNFCPYCGAKMDGDRNG